MRIRTFASLCAEHQLNKREKTISLLEVRKLFDIVTKDKKFKFTQRDIDTLEENIFQQDALTESFKRHFGEMIKILDQPPTKTQKSHITTTTENNRYRGTSLPYSTPYSTNDTPPPKNAYVPSDGFDSTEQFSY